MNEDIALLFRDTYARLALKARRLLPCVLCGVSPRLTLVLDDKLERVVELVVTCAAVPVLPLPLPQLPSHRHHHRHRRRHSHGRHRQAAAAAEEEGEGGVEESDEAPLPLLLAPPPPLLPSGLASYLQALSMAQRARPPQGGMDVGADAAFAVASSSSGGAAQAPLPALALALAPAPPIQHSSSSSSLIGRVASLTKTGGQTLLRRGHRALQLATAAASAPLLFSSSFSRSQQQPPQQQQAAWDPPLTPTAAAAAAASTAGGMFVDPRSLVELTPLASVPGARVVKYLGTWACCYIIYGESRNDKLVNLFMSEPAAAAPPALVHANVTTHTTTTTTNYYTHRPRVAALCQGELDRARRRRPRYVRTCPRVSV